MARNAAADRRRQRGQKAQDQANPDRDQAVHRQRVDQSSWSRAGGVGRLDRVESDAEDDFEPAESASRRTAVSTCSGVASLATASRSALLLGDQRLRSATRRSASTLRRASQARSFWNDSALRVALGRLDLVEVVIVLLALLDVLGVVEPVVGPAAGSRRGSSGPCRAAPA